MKTYDDWTEYLYNTLLHKINKINDININYICANKNFNLNFFNKHNELIIDYELLTYNPNVNFEYFVENKYFFWNENILNKMFGKNINNHIFYNKYHNQLCKYYNIDILYELYESWNNIQYIKNNYGHEIKYDLLSMNKNISWNIIIENINEKWDFKKIIMYNETITIDIILNNKKYFDESCLKLLSKNKSIKWNDVIKYNNIDWNYKDLSLNPNINFDIVLNNLNKKWCFNRLSSNLNINIDIILQYKQFNWNMYWYTFNPKFKLNDIDKIPITDTIIKNILINNYDEDRLLYCKNNNINIEEPLITALKHDNFELVIS